MSQLNLNQNNIWYYEILELIFNKKEHDYIFVYGQIRLYDCILDEEKLYPSIFFRNTSKRS